MSSRPTHKRTAGSSSSISSPTSGGPSQHQSKKTRFLDPSDDPTHFAEQVDSALEDAPSARRRGKVKNEGYDSDSSDDGEGVVRSRRKKAPTADAAEDEDMFAMDGGEADDAKSKPGNITTADGGAKKKDESYLRLGDIQGQEFNTKGSDDSSSESDDPEDEDDAERRKKAGMGFELSSFNMREEMEEGKFTQDGSYIRTFDPHTVHDRWMEGLADKDIKQARRSHKEREKVQREKMRAEERELEESGGESALQKELLAFLKKGESVIEALQRLGSRVPKSRPANKSAKTAPPADKAPAAKSIQADIDRITHLASTLMSLGDTDIYSKTYEELVRAVRSSGSVDQTWDPPSADLKFEYRWDVPDSAANPGETFGPFGEDDMLKWHKALYFGPVGEKVKVRPVGGEWQAWGDLFL